MNLVTKQQSHLRARLPAKLFADQVNYWSMAQASLAVTALHRSQLPVRLLLLHHTQDAYLQQQSCERLKLQLAQVCMACLQGWAAKVVRKTTSL